jgi:hypothetical protein
MSRRNAGSRPAHRLMAVKADLREALDTKDPNLTQHTMTLINSAGSYGPTIMGRDTAHALMDKWRNSLDVSENLYVTADIGAVIAVAGMDLPDDFLVRHEHLWSEHGFIYFEEPLRDDIFAAPIRAMSWHHGMGWTSHPTKSERIPGVEINLWSDEAVPGGPPLTTVLYSAGSDFLGYGRPATGWYLNNTGDMVQPVDDRNMSIPARFVIALMAFVRDELPAISVQPPPRSMNARLRYVGMPMQEVSVIELRRRAYIPRDLDETDGSGRSLRYRHVVRGHWHGYWVGPSHPAHTGTTEEKELIYVYLSPYIKGPEEAPLLPTDRVNLVRR